MSLFADPPEYKKWSGKADVRQRRLGGILCFREVEESHCSLSMYQSLGFFWPFKGPWPFLNCRIKNCFTSLPMRLKMSLIKETDKCTNSHVRMKLSKKPKTKIYGQLMVGGYSTENWNAKCPTCCQQGSAGIQVGHHNRDLFRWWAEASGTCQKEGNRRRDSVDAAPEIWGSWCQFLLGTKMDEL